MSKGSVSFRVLQFPPKSRRPFAVPELLERLKQLPPRDPGEDGNLAFGWTTPRHLEDAELVEESVRFGAWLRFSLAVAERKIPAKVFRHALRKACAEWCKQDGRDRVPKKILKDLRRDVTDQLLPRMPIIRTGIEISWHLEQDVIVVETTSAKMLDRVLLAFQLVKAFELTGDPVLVEPRAAALLWAGDDCRKWKPITWCQEPAQLVDEGSTACDFLTWCMFESSSGRGLEGKVAVDGPMTFRERDDSTATVAVRGIRTGLRVMGRCLASGKVLSRAVFHLEEWDPKADAMGWTFTLDQDLVIRSLQLPKCARNQSERESFEMRAEAFMRWWHSFRPLYAAYCIVRSKPAAWPQDFVWMWSEAMAAGVREPKRARAKKAGGHG